MYKISAKIFGLGDNSTSKMRYIPKFKAALLLLSLFPLESSNVFGQTINYSKKQVNLIQMFKALKKQTHYNVVWFEHNLDTKTTFDANFKNATIDEVLKQILLNQPASYEINGKTIVIKPNPSKLSEKLKKSTS